MDNRNDTWYPEDELDDSKYRLRESRRSFGNNAWKTIAFVSLTLVIILAVFVAFLTIKVLTLPSDKHISTPVVQQGTATLPTPKITQPLALPTPTPIPSTLTPNIPIIGTVFCQADASHGWNGWNGTSDWKVLNGMLLDNGTNNTPGGSITAPCQPPGPDYAVEISMQVVSFQACCVDNLGIVIRGSSGGGYAVGVEIDNNHLAKITTNYSSSNSLATANFSPGLSMHTYRAEVKGNTIKLLIDGGLLVSATDNQYLDAGQISLYSSFVQVEVTSCKMIVL